MTSFEASITEKNSTAQYIASDWSSGTLLMVHAIYSAGLSIYIYGITSAKRTHEVRPLLLIREGNTLLVKYSLDTHVRYSTYSPNFKSQKGPEFLHNYPIDNYLITAKK